MRADRWWLGLALLLQGCASGPAMAPVDDSGPDCEARQERLVQLLQQLPAQPQSLSLRVPLPSSSLGGALGEGPVLELSPTWVALDGTPIAAESHAQTLERLREQLSQAAASGMATAGEPARQPLYVAAAHDTDVRTLQAYLAALPESYEPKLLFGAPPLTEDRALSGHDLAARVFAERDPEKRHALAGEGYAAYSSCGAVSQAVSRVDGLAPEERWSRLRAELSSAVPECECGQLDAESLGYLVVAEQRAGGVAIGSLPVEFLEDERCSAAMPLRSVQQVLSDIEKFEEEFSGDWQQDALHFEEILTRERLLTYLCVALPGETLASLQRAKRTLYLRSGAACQPWQFEPSSPGAPFGTWRRQSSPGALPPLALHYRQFAEDIRIYGPVPSPESRATDEGPWACSQDFHLASVDERSIALDGGGRWFFTEAACKQAPATDAMPTGCVNSVVSGASIEPVPVVTPAAGAEADPDAEQE